MSAESPRERGDASSGGATGAATDGSRTTAVDVVSVIVPTCDDPEHLPQAIDSVLEQTVEDVDVEVVVVDSSSTDAARSIAEAYGDRVRYDWTEPNGVAAARNRGIELADGEVIGFCDADDYWHPRKLEFQLPAIEAGADVVYADEYLVAEDGELLTVLESPEIEDPETHHVRHFRAGGVGSRSVLARRDCLEAERFEESLTVREDPHLWTRLFAEFRPARVDRPLSFKRRRADSLTADREEGLRLQLREIELLVDRYPELEPYRRERERRARTLYAKTLLSDENRPSEARSVLLGLVASGHVTARTLTLLAVTLLPVRPDVAFRAVRDLFWKLRPLVG